MPPPLTSNRPGIGDSEALVGRAGVQLELGVQVGQSLSEEERDWTTGWGQSTLRIGIVDPIELFVSWGGLWVDRDSVAGVTRIVAGATDLLVGAKVALLDESRHGLTLTIAPSSSVPVGGGDFSSGSYDGSLRLMWARSLPKGWDRSGNVLFLITSDSSGRVLEQRRYDQCWPTTVVVHQRLHRAGDRPRRTARLDAGWRDCMGAPRELAMGFCRRVFSSGAPDRTGSSPAASPCAGSRGRCVSRPRAAAGRNDSRLQGIGI